MPRRTPSAALAIVLVLALAAPAAATDDPAAQRDQVRQQAADVAAQVNALEADNAQVVQALDALQANVSALDAELAQAQLEADQAAAALAAATIEVQKAQQHVLDLRETIREIAVDTYVSAGTVSDHEDVVGPDSDAIDLRNALAGFKARHDQDVLVQLKDAERDLTAKQQAAQAANDAAQAKQADVASRADTAHSARDQQEAYVESVQQRLDDRLAEAATLASIDKKLSAQIDADAQQIATRVTPTTPTRPPVPPGDWPVPPRPANDPKLATTHGITVAATIVDQLSAMLDAATAAGLQFSGSGYRDYDSQVALRRAHCGPTTYDIYYRPSSECSPPTARPGYSMHEQGLAIDFAEGGNALTSHDDPGWKWLDANAATYGFKNLDSEPWHWSTNGT
jgi:peptidoglycan hydrolase CwlO-like protein